MIDVAGGRTGRGIDVSGGSLDARRLTLHAAGRRAVVLEKARGTLEDLDVRGSSLAALQATNGADARVIRGEYDGQGGAALYAGRARLTVDGAHVRDPRRRRHARLHDRRGRRCDPHERTERREHHDERAHQQPNHTHF